MWVKKSEHGNVYVCLWENCNSKLFQNLDELEDHLFQHIYAYSAQPAGSSSGYTCQIKGCGIPLVAQDEFVMHMKIHLFHAHKQQRGFQIIEILLPEHSISQCNFIPSSRIVYSGNNLMCDWAGCQANFSDICEYINHLNGHIDACHESKNFRFRCLWGSNGSEGGCQLDFLKKDTLRVHLHTHTGEKLCACPFCGAFFCSQQKYIDHILRRQEGNSEYVCTYCKKVFPSQRLLNNHCKRHVKAFKCPNCSVAVNSSWELKRHISTVHAKIKTLACGECGRSFFQKSDLDKHMKLHYSIELFHCNFCEKKYRWKKQLKEHMKMHDEGYIACPYKCHLCDMNFKRGVLLSKHFINVHQMSIPMGFSRFSYKKFPDGLFRLRTKRCLNKDLAIEQGLIAKNDEHSNFVYG